MHDAISLVSENLKIRGDVSVSKYTTELSTIKLRERNLQVQNHHLHLVFLTDTRSTDSSPLFYSTSVDPISPP